MNLSGKQKEFRIYSPNNETLMHFQHNPGCVITACPLLQLEHFMIVLCRICIKSLESKFLILCWF